MTKEHFCILPDSLNKMDNTEVREHFLLEDLFQPGKCVSHCVQEDRLLIFGLMPAANEAMTFESAWFQSSAAMLERREMGIVNLGEQVEVTVDGKAWTLEHITLAQTRGMTELYEYVERNLRMIYKYIEPDMTINTINSTRQDVGTAPDWRIYFSTYLYMALQTGDKEFRWIADRMLEQSESQSSIEEQCPIYPPLPYFEFMPFWLLDEKLKNTWTTQETQKPYFDYDKFFENSGIVRARQGHFSLTLLENRPVFAKLQYDTHTAYLRMAGTFYAQGQFVAESIERTENGYRMTYRRRWGYKGLLPEKQGTADWRKMDHSKRPDVMMQDFVFHVDVTIEEQGAAFHVTTEGVENVLTKFEILLQPGGLFATGDMQMHTHAGDYVYQKCDETTYAYLDHTKLVIGGGCWKNSYGEHMRGSLPVDQTSFFVAMTSQTPMDETFTLRFEL